jgi:hypothetical protein
MTATTPSLPSPDSNKLKKEIGGFLLFLGVILTAVGYWAYNALKGNPHDLFGLSRNVALGAPVLLLGILHVLAGVLLFVTSKKMWAIVGAIASTLMALFYFTFFVAATGKLPLNLISALILIIPIGVWARTHVFLRAFVQK